MHHANIFFVTPVTQALFVDFVDAGVTDKTNKIEDDVNENDDGVADETGSDEIEEEVDSANDSDDEVDLHKLYTLETLKNRRLQQQLQVATQKFANLQSTVLSLGVGEGKKHVALQPTHIATDIERKLQEVQQALDTEKQAHNQTSERLNQVIKEKDAKLLEATQKIVEQKKEHATEMEKSKELYEKKLTELNKIQSDNRGKITALNQEIQTLKSSLQHLTSELKTARDECDLLKVANSSASGDNAQQNAALLATFEAQKRELSQQLEIFEARLTASDEEKIAATVKLQSQLAEHDTITATLKQEAQTSKQDAETSKQDAETLKQEVARLKQDAQTSLQTQKAELDAEILTLKQKEEQDEKNLNDAQELLQGKTTELAASTENCNNITVQSQQKDTTIMELNEQVAKTRADLVVMTQKEAVASNQQEQLLAAQTQLTEANTKITEGNSKMTEANSKIEELQREKDTMEVERNAANQTVTDCKTEAQDKETSANDKIQLLEGQLQQLADTKLELETLKQSNQQNKNLNEELLLANTKITEADKKIADLQQEKDSLQVERNVAKQTVTDCETGAKHKEEELLEANSKIIEANSKIAALKDEYDLINVLRNTATQTVTDFKTEIEALRQELEGLKSGEPQAISVELEKAQKQSFNASVRVMELEQVIEQLEERNATLTLTNVELSSKTRTLPALRGEEAGAKMKFVEVSKQVQNRESELRRIERKIKKLLDDNGSSSGDSVEIDPEERRPSDSDTTAPEAFSMIPAETIANTTKNTTVRGRGEAGRANDASARTGNAGQRGRADNTSAQRPAQRPARARSVDSKKGASSSDPEILDESGTHDVSFQHSYTGPGNDGSAIFGFRDSPPR
jgi:epidermal growth factor receptor substrate 15